MFTLPTKSPTPKVPQPERLDEVYEALKRGLQTYLQVHQLELDNLSRQIMESKRNSRLGFLYDLDKQVKVTERFMRRLEFHISKVDELYDAYCMQRRLRDGASRIVKAYTASPGSREARESLTEAHKGYREYSESMCTLENELESLLGEFRIKMKGLAGFARLCAGDQYEIFMKYGRQRWKLRGRIEVNGRQVWDSEEMVFMPLVSEFLSIKVTELKSLANHVVVGTVSCETKELFTAQCQMVAVDINDLGTVKLSLEVTWNPFDKDDQNLSTGTVSKVSTVTKRLAGYNQSPPDTPSLREQAFYNMLRRQEDVENGTAWSNSSESSDDSSSPQPSVGTRYAHKNLVQPELKASLPAIHISFAPREPTNSILLHPDDPDEEEEESDAGPLREEGCERRSVTNGHTRCCRSLSHISESSTDGELAETLGYDATTDAADVLESAVGSLISEETRSPLRTENTELEIEATAAAATTEVEVEEEVKSSQGECGAHVGLPESESEPRLEEEISLPGTEADALGGEDMLQKDPSQGVAEEASTPGVRLEAEPAEDGIQILLSSVRSALEGCLERFPELQPLEQELGELEDTLTGLSPNMILTIEAALGSFDFLEDEEEEAEGNEEEESNSAVHSQVSGPPCGHVEMEQRGEHSWGHGTEHQSTGCPALDSALVAHLQNCSAHIQHLAASRLQCPGVTSTLECLLREAQSLEFICQLSKNTPTHVTVPIQALPQLDQCQGAVLLWDRCTDHSAIYITSAKRFLSALAEDDANFLSDDSTSTASIALLKLVEDIIGHRFPQDKDEAAREVVTIFQFWSYLKNQNISCLRTHIASLAKQESSTCECGETRPGNEDTQEPQDDGLHLIISGSVASTGF